MAPHTGFRTELFRKGRGDRRKGIKWSFIIKWAYSNVIYLLIMKIFTAHFEVGRWSGNMLFTLLLTGIKGKKN